VPGKYGFLTPGNTDVLVMPLAIGSFYLIERMFISGNLAAEDYLSSIDTPATIPLLQIRRSRDTVAASMTRIPIVQFSINRESPLFIKSDKLGDTLIMSMTGVLRQIANTVGLDPLIVVIGLSVYQINEKFYNQAMRTAIAPEFGLSKKFQS
jgi:hypothetical protein